MLIGQDLLVIIALALLFFGPKQLPQLAKGIGRSVREFRQGVQGEEPPQEEPKE
jgi:sec-independent protein translocase protein TatA